jgi:choline dehydrogenase-like flavoprotein
VAELVTTRRRFFGDWAGLYYHRRLKYYPKIEPSSGVQRAKAMLNIAGNFFFEDERFSDPAAAAKQILREARFGRLGKLRLRDFLAAIRQSFSARHAIYDYLWRGREFVPTTGRVLLEVHCEQPPNPENRIRLAGTTDQLGVLRSRLIWHASDQERTTIGEFCAIVDQQLAKQNLGRLRPLFDLGGPGDGWSRLLGDNNHHIGTTRMATDASLGVVDSDCRVFGVSNLYIGGSSVFPTSGHSNPTLTLIALAIRLAEPIGQSVRNR